MMRQGFALRHHCLWMQRVHPAGRKLTKCQNQGKNSFLDSCLWFALGWGWPRVWWATVRGNKKETDMLWPPGEAWSDGSKWEGSCDSPCRDACLFLCISFVVILCHTTLWAPCWDWAALCGGEWKAGLWGRVKQGAGSILMGPAWGGLTLASCWMSVPIAHPKYSHSLHRAKGLPMNLGKPHECPPRSKSQWYLCFSKPKGVLLGSVLKGAKPGSALDSKIPQWYWVTWSWPPRRERKVALRCWRKKGKPPKGQTPLHPGSALCQCFSWFHFRNNQPLIIKSELLGKWS